MSEPQNLNLEMESKEEGNSDVSMKDGSSGIDIHYATAVANYRDESCLQFLSNEARMHHAMVKKVC